MLNTRGIGLGCGKSCKSLSTSPRSWASKTCAKRPGQEFGASPLALWFPMIYDQLLASQPHFLKPFTNQSLFVRFHNECIYSPDFTMNAFINQEIFHNLFTNHSSFLASEAEAAAHSPHQPGVGTLGSSGNLLAGSFITSSASSLKVTSAPPRFWSLGKFADWTRCPKSEFGMITPE